MRQRANQQGKRAKSVAMKIPKGPVLSPRNPPASQITNLVPLRRLPARTGNSLNAISFRSLKRIARQIRRGSAEVNDARESLGFMPPGTVARRIKWPQL